MAACFVVVRIGYASRCLKLTVRKGYRDFAAAVARLDVRTM